MLNKVGKADDIFSLFEESERMVLAVSGGKDSMCMADLMPLYKEVSGKNLELHGVYVDNGLGSLTSEELKNIENFLHERGVKFHVIEDDETQKIIEKKLKPMNACFVCTRERRKRLLLEAKRLGARKVALAHNLDDVIETLFLNILFGREISTFLPKQELFGGEYFIVRPLILIEAKKTAEYVKMASIPFVESRCPYRNENKRETIRRILKELEREHPLIKKNVLRALMNVKEDFLWAKFYKWKEEIVE